MILVTGGTGLVGSHLIYKLLTMNLKVRALKRKESDITQVKKIFNYYSDKADELFGNIEWIEGNVADKASIFEAMENVTRVYHTAAFVSFNKRDRQNIFEFNITGTANVVDAALEMKTEKLCFVSSTAALGNPDDEFQVDESSAWHSGKNRSAYSISKYKSEMEVWRGITEGLNAVIVNPSIIIGPGNWQRSSSKMFYEIWKGLKFYTKGITGYVDVRDVVNIMIELMEKNIFGEKFVVSDGNYSYQEIFNMIADALGKKRPSLYATKLLTKTAFITDAIFSFISGKEPVITGETISASGSKIFFRNNKITEKLNYQFMPINESIKTTAEYFLQDVSI